MIISKLIRENEFKEAIKDGELYLRMKDMKWLISRFVEDIVECLKKILSVVAEFLFRSAFKSFSVSEDVLTLSENVCFLKYF